MAGGPGNLTFVFSLVLVACGSSTSSQQGGGTGTGGSHASGASGSGAGAEAAGRASTGGAAGMGQAGFAVGGAGTSGGAAGNAAGRAAGGDDSSAGGAAWVRTETEACMVYTGASCQRFAECFGARLDAPYPCAESCPDVLFAPGSTRTLEGLLACAPEYATLSCDDLMAGRLPACVTPGTKQIGEACLYASQCESLVCKYEDTATCGTCAHALAEGGDCSAPDAGCAGNLLCRGGICRSQTLNVMQPGQACADFTECDQVDSFCNQQGVCEAYPEEGEPCPNNHCTREFYCSPVDETCRPRPTLGQPCADGDDPVSGRPACAAELACTATRTTEAGTCEERVTAQVGAECSVGNVSCVGGSKCNCVDVACTNKRCAVARLTGQSCGDSGNDCNPPLTCSSVCLDKGYQGKFEAACLP